MVEATSKVFEDKSYEQRHHIVLYTAEYREKHIADVAYHVDLSLPEGEW